MVLHELDEIKEECNKTTCSSSVRQPLRAVRVLFLAPLDAHSYGSFHHSVVLGVFLSWIDHLPIAHRTMQISEQLVSAVMLFLDKTLDAKAARATIKAIHGLLLCRVDSPSSKYPAVFNHPPHLLS